MNALAILLESASLGVELKIQDGKIVAHPRGVLPKALKAALLKEKQEVVQALSEPRTIARLAWVSAVSDVTGFWDAHVAAERAAGREPVWLDPDVDQTLEGCVNECIKAGDLLAALVAVEAWRRSWLDLLKKSVPAVVAAPAGFNPEVDRRAREMIEESEGRRPHPNQSVYDMFAGSSRYCSPDRPASGHRLWRSVHGVVVCGDCHPPAITDLVSEWLPITKGDPHAC